MNNFFIKKITNKIKRLFNKIYLNLNFISRFFSKSDLKFIFLKLIKLIRKKGLINTLKKINETRIIFLKSGDFVIEKLPRMHYSTELELNKYKEFIEKEKKSIDENKIKEEIKKFKYFPKFSIVVPVYNTKKVYLNEFIESVRNQYYPNWELCIADDFSDKSYIKPFLKKYTNKDKRIKTIFRERSGHISKCTNSALSLSTGEYICLMDHDDLIPQNALFEFAKKLNEDPKIDMIYSDEDKIDINYYRYEPFFKPSWSPETLEGCMYTAHFACYRTPIVKTLGGFRSGFDGAQDYDFVLRFTEKTDKIVHIPKILYHWRAIPGSTAQSMDQKNYVLDSAVKALKERVQRMNGEGIVKIGDYAGSFQTYYKLKGKPLISIIIPTAGYSKEIRSKKVNLLENVISSIYKKTNYRNFEIIVVDNNDLSEKTLDFLKEKNCKLTHFKGDFNIAKKMNLGANHASGEYLLFMNDDIEIINEEWMENLIQICQRRNIGAVGAKLIYENETLQHVGVSFHKSGLPDHIRRGYDRNEPGHFFSSTANRNYLAVSGAVLITKKNDFLEVNGFEENFPINYNDIDYCLKLQKINKRVVFCASAKLYHFESTSREAYVDKKEIELFLHKWRDVTLDDPFYNVNLHKDPPDFLIG